MTSSPSVRLLSGLADSLIAAFFPDDCRVCDLPLEGWSRTPVCEPCWALVRPAAPEYVCLRCGVEPATGEALDPEGRCAPCGIQPPVYDAAVSFGRHEGELRKLIHLFKYDQMQPLAARLGDLLATVGPRLGDVDLVLAAPLHWRRRHARGFNQAGLLAARAARAWGLPFDSGALKRTKATPPQAGLSRVERLANVRGAFRVRPPQAVAGRGIVLIDDVMTTGATLDACARALKRVGARTVTAVTLARASLERRSTG